MITVTGQLSTCEYFSLRCFRSAHFARERTKRARCRHTARVQLHKDCTESHRGLNVAENWSQPPAGGLTSRGMRCAHVRPIYTPYAPRLSCFSVLPLEDIPERKPDRNSNLLHSKRKIEKERFASSRTIPVVFNTISDIYLHIYHFRFDFASIAYFGSLLLNSIHLLILFLFIYLFKIFKEIVFYRYEQPEMNNTISSKFQLVREKEALTI